MTDAQIISLQKQRSLSTASGRKALIRNVLGEDEVKNPISGACIVIVILASVALASFGHWYYFGALALVAGPITAGLDFYGARVLVNAAKTKSGARKFAAVLMALGIGLVSGVFDFRGIVALDQWTHARYETSMNAWTQEQDQETRAQRALEEAQTTLDNLPRLPSEPEELRRMDTRTLNRMEANLTATRELVRGATRERELAENPLPEPQAPSAALTHDQILGVAILLGIFKLLAFWVITPGSGVVVPFALFGKRRPEPMSAKQSAALTAAGRGGKWREAYEREYGPIPVKIKKDRRAG